MTRSFRLQPIVAPFIHHHHLMLQHGNEWLHNARIYTQFLEAENIQVLARPEVLTNADLDRFVKLNRPALKK